jgi:hypothetical protein
MSRRLGQTPDLWDGLPARAQPSAVTVPLEALGPVVLPPSRSPPAPVR